MMLACSTGPLYSGPSMQSLLGSKAIDVEGNPNNNSNPEFRLAIIGHRGCGKNIISEQTIITADARPSIMENTILSFDLAARNGAGFVEFDVQVTKDGHPIIFHDDFIVTKENNALSHKRIGDLTLEEFLSIGYQKVTGKSQKSLVRKTVNGSFSSWNVSIDDSLCTLKDAFEKVSPSVGFNIELKFDDYEAIPAERLRKTLESVLKVVEESHGGRKIFFSSFHPDAAILLRQLQSKYPVLFLTDGVEGHYPDPRRNSLKAAVEVCQTGNLQGIVSEVKAILQHPEAVKQIKASGLSLLTYGEMNNLADIFHIQESLGVDGLIVDHVREMVMVSLNKGSVPDCVTS